MAEFHHVPLHIQELSKRKLADQYEAKHGELLLFDSKTCSEIGTYGYGSDSLWLEAKSVAWQGKASFNLHDILEGRTLDFPTHATFAPVKSKLPSHFREETSVDSPQVSKKWIWIFSTVLASVAALTLIQNNSQTTSSQQNFSAQNKTDNKSHKKTEPANARQPNPAPRNSPTNTSPYPTGKVK